MDISQFSDSEIMQLPKNLFGARQLITFSDAKIFADNYHFISDMALPNKIVVEEISHWYRIQVEETTPQSVMFSWALGDHLPATDAEFDAMESMFTGFNEMAEGVRYSGGGLYLDNLYQSFHPQGRRIILRVRALASIRFEFTCSLIFAAFPTSVPEWFR